MPLPLLYASALFTQTPSVQCARDRERARRRVYPRSPDASVDFDRRPVRPKNFLCLGRRSGQRRGVAVAHSSTVTFIQGASHRSGRTASHARWMLAVLATSALPETGPSHTQHTVLACEWAFKFDRRPATPCILNTAVWAPDVRLRDRPNWLVRTAVYFRVS